MFGSFYQGKRVLVTGHTGFKGGWLSLWLKKLGAEVWGISMPPPTQPNLYEIIQPGTFRDEIECDICNLADLSTAVASAKPEVIFHLAAQPIVRRSYTDPLATLQTNAVGTANVLESVRQTELNCTIVVVTSDKCYENREWDFAYRENDPLGGHDVYSMSKAAAELVTQAWHRSFFVPDPKLGPIATVRAGNVIGGGDYAPDRLVPDCVRFLMEGKPIVVRNPLAIRPWQHVLECLSGYLWLAARLAREGKNSCLAGPFNFGPATPARQPVRRLVEEVLKTWSGKWEEVPKHTAPHEATLLYLSVDKASALLNWCPCWDFGQAVQHTMDWYKTRHLRPNHDMRELTSLQIDKYTAIAQTKGQVWAMLD